MFCRVYLVRHGETEWNATRRIQGNSDIKLSVRGREQAHRLSNRLANENISCFYSSDMIRARETAQILAAPHGLEVNPIAGLRELNFGPWEGMTIEELEAKSSWSLMDYFRNPMDTHIPGGEKLTEMIERCDLAMGRIIRGHMDETIAVVAHGGSIRCIICSALGLSHSEMWRIVLENTGLSRIDFPESGKGMIKMINDFSHLDKHSPHISKTV